MKCKTVLPSVPPLIRGLVALGIALVALSVGLAGATAAELPKGLVLHYSFDQATPDGAVPDRSGLKNDGRGTAAKWTATGKQGGGLEMTPGSFVAVPATDALALKQFTLAVWFKTTKFDGVWRRLFDRRADQGFALGIGGDLKDVQSRGKAVFMVNGGAPCLSDNVLADGIWHHVAATYDGENLRLYVDGLPQKQVVALKGEPGAAAEELTIGMNRANPTDQEKGQSFEGLIDDVMVFGRALSADEIKAMVYAVDPLAGKPKFTKQQVEQRLRQLKYLYEEGLLTDEFYNRKVAECQTNQ